MVVVDEGEAKRYYEIVSVMIRAELLSCSASN